MQALQPDTHAPVPTRHDSFSVLPSPSTFGLSSSTYAPSLADYAPFDLPTEPYTSYDFPSPDGAVPPHTRGHARSASSSSLASLDALDSPPSDRASSPATSFHSADSPLFDPKPVPLASSGVDEGVCLASSQHLVTEHLAFETPGSPFAPSLNNDDEHKPMMSPYTPGQLPSPAHSPSPSSAALVSPAPLGALSANGLVAPIEQQQQQMAYEPYAYGSPVTLDGGDEGVYLSAPEQPPQVVYAPPPPSLQYASPPQQHYQHAQQQQQQPLQLVVVNGVTYAIAPATPAPAPTPAAIETPHGTYYFVPNVPQPQLAGMGSEYAVPVALSSGLPAPVAAQIPNLGLGLALPPSPAAPPAPAPAAAVSAVPPVTRSSLSPAAPQDRQQQQKIRLPVGQGKRGSTKRAPAKKDQVKRFICPYTGCGRAFARNFNCQAHYKSHLGVRDFNCPHCPKKFSRRHDRARHCSAVHDSHVDRDGNIVGSASAAGSASASPSSSHGHEVEHDELEYDFGLPGEGFALSPDGLSIDTAAAFGVAGSSSRRM
ncbi:hypothetical protein JCM10213_000621 [Rhodosporidiobolus nylandii]